MSHKQTGRTNLKTLIEVFSVCRLSQTARISLILTLAAATALGCWEMGPKDQSVRFNDRRTEKDFGRLPPLPMYESDKGTSHENHGEGYGEEDYERVSKYLEESTQLWNLAKKEQSGNDMRSFRNYLRQSLEHSNFARSHGWIDPAEDQTDRNWAIDMLDALEALDHGSALSAVLAYVIARSYYNSVKPAEEIKQKIDEARKDKNLADNVLYLEAAILYRDGSESAASAFNRLAAKYPKSEKREAALFMAGVAAMKQSKSFENAREFGTQSAPCSECRDDMWRSARSSFERVLREYPRGRYTNDARGWIAYLHLGVGDRASALVEYYRMLAIEGDPFARREAVISLRLTRRRADETEMRRVEKELEDEPRVALAYAYHNIYNYALPPLLWWEKPDEARQKKTRDELERIATFSKAMMRRYPAVAVGGGFALRLAQTNLELDRNRDAADMARRAQKSGVKNEDRAESLFIEGVAEHRLKRYKQARQALTTLVNDHTDSRIIESGRRSLAMVAEDMGDLGAALEQYLALDYHDDAAYFIDILMKPEQLAEFIKQHPEIEQHDELMYALGIRYLRDHRWNDERKTFSQVRTIGRNPIDGQDYGDCGCGSAATPKEDYYDIPKNGIRPHWIEQDLRTADDLERLEKAVDLAEGDEAKAEALYQLASYHYQGTLLFYNPAAWKGERHYRLSYLDSEGKYRQPGESQLLYKHMQQHDRAAHALPIFLEVVRRFPNTRAASDAFYTAAVCHERLAEYNEYWRGIYENGGHAGEHMVTYENVKQVYPKYVYPRGTYGWEPATRTVNSGPGWYPSEKPRPRPTRMERLSVILDTMMKQMSKTAISLDKWALGLERAIANWFSEVGHKLWLIVALSGLAALNWRAWYARKALRFELARCNKYPAEQLESLKSRPEVDWLSSRFEGYMNQDTRDEWKVILAGFIHRLKRLMSDEKARPIVRLNASLHGAIIVLLLAIMVW